MLNKDLLIAAIFALGIHIFLFSLNPFRPTTPPRLAGEKKVIEVSLVKPPEPPKPKPKKVVKKIKVKPRKLPVPEPIVKEEVKKPPEKEETEDEVDFIQEEVETREVEEVVETEPESNTANIKAVITTAIPDYRENPKPYYPRIARRRGYQGTVVLRVEVLANGRVGRVELEKSSGYSSLDNSALKSVKDWRFIPGRRGNTLITMWVNVPIIFRLEDRR